jgi:uncharacterized protein
MKSVIITFVLAFAFLGSAVGADLPKQVLFFSKSAGYEHPITYRDTANPSFLEKQMLELGRENNIVFTFSKEGTIFTPENIAKYDAFFFYTSGDLVNQLRNGHGDNYPLMTAEGKEAFLQAIRNGKGFIGAHSAVATFPTIEGSINSSNASTVDPYSRMLGAEYIGHSVEQKARLIQVDRKFPGMANVPADFPPFDEWPAMKQFAPDLHVIMALECATLRGNVYQRPNFPITWARMEGKGRVFFTAMGHNEGIWKDVAFRQMILNGIRWATGLVDADITPNLATATPLANEIPEGARKVIDSAPPNTKSP